MKAACAKGQILSAATITAAAVVESIPDVSPPQAPKRVVGQFFAVDIVTLDFPSMHVPLPDVGSIGHLPFAAAPLAESFAVKRCCFLRVVVAVESMAATTVVDVVVALQVWQWWIP